MAEQVPEDVKRDRMERLVDVVQRAASGRNASRVGRVEEVLVEGPSRTDSALLRGRTRRNTTVNFHGSLAARRSRRGRDPGGDVHDAAGERARAGRRLTQAPVERSAHVSARSRHPRVAESTLGSTRGEEAGGP